MIETEHLDADLVAAYLERNLPEGERESVEAHLSECGECCEEMAAIDETIRTKQGPVSYRRYAIPAVAAAAILAAVFVARPWEGGLLTTPGMEPVAIERASPDLASTRVEAVWPLRGDVVDPGEVRLQWRSAGEGARYLVTITTAQGDSVWGAMKTDTVATVPIGVIESDREYLWYVDALLRDGGVASTGIAHFRSRP